MKLSVIIPVLNEQEIIIQNLQFLKQICSEEVELIVVDGGSHDQTTTFAKPYVDSVINAIGGRAEQMNKGATIATGDTLVFLHIDTKLPNNFINAIRTVLAQGRYDWGRFDVSFNNEGFMFSIIAFMMNLRSRITSIATGDQAIFIKKTTFDELGGYPDIKLMEDVAISKRLRKLSKPACLNEKVITSGRRWQDKGIIKTIFLMWFLRLAYFMGVDTEKLNKLYA